MRGMLRKLAVVLGGAGVMVAALQAPAQAVPAQVTSASSGKCWDVRGESGAEGAVIQLYSCKGSVVWQTFGIAPGQMSTGYLKCVTAVSANNDAGLVQRTCAGLVTQRWDLRQAGTNWVFSLNGTNLCITDTGISGGGRRIELRLRTCDDSLSQQFRVPGL